LHPIKNNHFQEVPNKPDGTPSGLFISVEAMIQSFQPPIRGVILDLDGVLWRGSEPIGDLPRIFDRLRELQMQFILATNNATLSVEMYQEKLRLFGVAISVKQIINSAQALAFGLSQLYPQGGPVYMIGEAGLQIALSERGFVHSEDGQALAVVVGLDRGITYDKIRRASLLIRQGTPFWGTNPDRTFPAPEGLIPGAGSLLAAIETATDVAPVIAGKPSRPMFDLALERLGTSPLETLMIGDRLETDIEGAHQVGCRAALVLTGVTTLEQALRWNPPPDCIAPDLTTLLFHEQ